MKKCEKCGKIDFDDDNGCEAPSVFSRAVGDWVCTADREKSPLKPAWCSPETAPRDKSIIAHFDGHPWALVAVYSPAMEQFVVADIEASTYQGKDDLYFTTEWCGIGDLLGWMDMPELPEARKS